MYFEDRPVDEVDRAAALAWMTEGNEGEKRVRQEFMTIKLAKDKKANEAMFEIREKGRQHRKAAM